MTSDGMRTPPSRVVALALVVGTFVVAQEVLTDLAGGKRINVAGDIMVVLIFWAAWAFLTPAVLAAVRRWPLDAKPAYRPLLIHAVVAVVLAAAQSTISFVLRAITLSLRTGTRIGEAFRVNADLTPFVWGIFSGVFFYVVVVMVYNATRFRSMYVAERMSAAALEAELTRSKLDALRSQLRPHFLFNTLNAISVFITEDAEKAQQMILRLSALLRRSLDEEAHEVSLEQELAFVDDYLDIQRSRFGDRLNVLLEIDRAAFRARVPVFLLQPLLENAIEHGKSDDKPTNIVMTATREADTLRIRLVDDGPGVTNGSSLHEGIGLGNTRVRLQHLYGSRAAVTLGTADGHNGARVDIRIPFREAMA